MMDRLNAYFFVCCLKGLEIIKNIRRRGEICSARRAQGGVHASLYFRRINPKNAFLFSQRTLHVFKLNLVLY